MKKPWVAFSSFIICVLILAFSSSCARALLNQNSGGGGSDQSSDTPPDAPQGFDVENGDDSLIFSWDPDADGRVSYYELTYRKNDSSIWETTIDVGDVTEYELYDLTNEQGYLFMLMAYALNTEGEAVGSEPSLFVEGTPRDTNGPDQPSNFTLLEITNGTPSGNVSSTQNYFMDLTWTNPDDRDFQGIQLYRKQGANFTSENDGAEIIASGNISSYQDLDIELGVIYYYKVRAYDDVPNYTSLEVADYRTGLIVPSEIVVEE